MASPQGLQRTFGVWSAANLIAGSALWAGGRNEGVRRFGRQTFAWAVVNSAIAGWAASRPTPDVQRLRKIVTINAFADVGYIAVGALMYRRGLRPDGAAVIVQGGFLLALDSHYAYHLPRAQDDVWDDMEPDSLAG